MWWNLQEFIVPAYKMNDLLNDYIQTKEIQLTYNAKISPEAK